MHRGTTPFLTIKLKGIEATEMTSIFLTFKQKDYMVEKTLSAIQIDETDAHIIYVELTQDETLGFQDGYVHVQLRAITHSEARVASKVVTIPINHILKGGRI